MECNLLLQFAYIFQQSFCGMCGVRLRLQKTLIREYYQQMSPNLTHAEGFILGVGVKMFTIAGPVIVYGVSASVVYGFLYWIYQVL